MVAVIHRLESFWAIHPCGGMSPAKPPVVLGAPGTLNLRRRRGRKNEQRRGVQDVRPADERRVRRIKAGGVVTVKGVEPLEVSDTGFNLWRSGSESVLPTANAEAHFSRITAWKRICPLQTVSVNAHMLQSSTRGQ